MTDEQVLAKELGMVWRDIPERPCFEGWGGEGEVPDDCDALTEKDCLHRAKGCTWESCKSGALSEYMKARLNPDFSSPAVLWSILRTMAKRKDWMDFLWSMMEFGVPDTPFGVAYFIKWLTDPGVDGRIRLVPLAAEWCREHTEKGESENA